MSNKRSLEQSSHSDPTAQTKVVPPTTTSTTTNSTTNRSSANQSKKVKFAAGSSSNQKPSSFDPLSSTFDPIDQSSDLNFDELNQVGKIKKGRVKIEGYDSDSSTENKQVRSSKKKSNHHQQDGDEDMFGDEEQDDQNDPNFNIKFDKIDEGLRIKKGAEAKDYLDLGDIEGQEFGQEEDEPEGGREEEDTHQKNGHQKQSSGDGPDSGVDDYSEEEEDFVPGDEFANADDAPRARRKSKKGMGFLLSRFNMAEELQEGRMAADGSYVPSAKDPEAVHDNWLEGVNSKKAIKQAREAKQKREEQLRNQVENDQALSSLRTRKDCYIALLGLLPAGDGRSVTQIICQLGNIKRSLQTTDNMKKKKILQKKSVIEDLVPDSIIRDNDDSTLNHQHPNPTTSTSENQNESSSNRAEEEIRLDTTIAEITDLASTLMGTHGDLDIYELTHGSIIGVLKSEGLVPRDWKAPSSSYLETLFQSNSTKNNKTITESNEKNNSTRKTIISRPSTNTTTTAHVTTTSIQPNNQPAIYYRFLPSATSDPNQPPVDPNNTFGPFDASTMYAWAQQGFFGTNFDRIIVKLDYSQDGLAPWGTWNQIIMP